MEAVEASTEAFMNFPRKKQVVVQETAHEKILIDENKAADNSLTDGNMAADQSMVADKTMANDENVATDGSMATNGDTNIDGYMASGNSQTMETWRPATCQIAGNMATDGSMATDGNTAAGETWRATGI